MHYEARVQAVRTYYAKKLGRKIEKKEARTIWLAAEQYMQVIPWWCASHRDCWEYFSYVSPHQEPSLNFILQIIPGPSDLSALRRIAATQGSTRSVQPPLPLDRTPLTPDPSPTCSTLLSGRTVYSPSPPAAYPPGFLVCRSTTVSASGRLSPGLLGLAASSTAAADHHRRPPAFDCRKPTTTAAVLRLDCSAAPLHGYPSSCSNSEAGDDPRCIRERSPHLLTDADAADGGAHVASPRRNRSCSLLQRIHPVFSSAQWCGTWKWSSPQTEDEVEPPNGRNF
ncbi:hypothetical protein EJB05_37184 [Eragrostis curvula]|uniref:Uncharacterized protein n=1 Tax=Eragrostis curvula TaxID=38414 RepID=A0A5J9TSD3_9POAL|nr:hypothetical protein EJB05_37184 [Eragrostis curvula]